MLNSLVELKNSVIQRFGPVLGYIILVVGALVALSILGFLIKTVFKLAVILAVVGLVLFGVYKITEIIKANKAGQK